MKQKLLFLIPSLGHGGAEKVLVNLVNNLSQEKYDVTVQTLFDVGVHRQHLMPHIHYIGGLKHQFRGNSHIQKLFTPKFLYRYIVRDSYDIVISYLEGITARLVSGCSNPHVKKMCWLHTELNTPALASRCFRNLQEAQNAYNRYDAIVAVSNQIKESFEKQVSVQKSVVVKYNTNETEHIAFMAKKPISEILSDGPNICTVGKLITVKGFDRLLDAHKRLLDECYPHHVYILGIGEEQKALESKIKEYGVGDSFTLLGFRDNPYQYVARCDLYVCSSRREGFSTAVTEALIVGTPVVSTDCSGAKELLGEHDEYGLVVENSAEGVYDGMKKMLSDPALLAHYKEKAKERGSFFSREKTVRAVEEMLDNL